MIVAGLLTAASVSALQGSRSARVLEDRIVDGAAADGALRELVAAIQSPVDDLEAKVLARPDFPVMIGAATVLLSIEGEGGKINPILTPQPVLEKYLNDAGLADAAREALMIEINTIKPANDSAAALEAVYKRLLPVRDGLSLEQDFSAYNDRAGIDPLYASERVLTAVPDITAQHVQKILAERSSGQINVSGLSEFFVGGSARFSLIARVRHSDASQHLKRCVIEIASSGIPVPLDCNL